MTPKAICSVGANKESWSKHPRVSFSQHFTLGTEGQQETTASNTIKPELFSILRTGCTPFPTQVSPVKQITQLKDQGYFRAVVMERHIYIYACTSACIYMQKVI